MTLAVLDHKHRITVGGIADRGVRDGYHPFFLRQNDANVGEHARPEPLRRIFQLATHAKAPATDLNPGVDRDDAAAEDLVRVGLDADLDALPVTDTRQLALREREVDVDGIELFQWHDRGPRRQVLAQVDAADAQAAVEGCADALFVDQGLLPANSGLRGVERGAGLVVVLLGHGFVFDQLGGALELEPRQRAFREQSLQLRLVGAIVEFEQQVALFDALTRVEVDHTDLARDLAGDLDARHCGQAADDLQIGLPHFVLGARRRDHWRWWATRVGRGLLGSKVLPAENAAEDGRQEQGNKDNAGQHNDLLRRSGPNKGVGQRQFHSAGRTTPAANGCN